MTAAARATIAHFLAQRPAGIRKKAATEEQLAQFEARHGEIPEPERWFLASCGGGVVGPEWIDDIHELDQTHRKFRHEASLANGWTMTNVFPFGWDGFGNPLAICLSSGKVLMEDHNFGGIHELAPSLEAFFLSLLKVAPAAG